VTQKILVVDDEEDIRNLVCGILEDEGYATAVAANAQQAYDIIDAKPPVLIIQDIWLQGSEDDGLEILAKTRAAHPYIPFIMISGHGTIETAVRAIQDGAYDFIEKPFKSDRLLLMVRRALENAELRKENAYLKKTVEERGRFVAGSATGEQLKSMLGRIGASNSRVLITGEAGTGKDLAAYYMHSVSDRSGGEFRVLNCASLEPGRLEEELFGVEGGVKGALELADGGTLLLDQVGDMPLDTQGKITRVLQDQRFCRKGGSEEITVDVRIIAASNTDLEEEIKDGNFREDLYYRLNVMPVQIPPLRKRVDDIPALVTYFVEDFCEKSGRPPCVFSQEAMAVLTSYHWPGNIRQLRNVVEWVLIMRGDKGEVEIMPEDLPPHVSGLSQSAGQGGGLENMSYMALPLRAAREHFERDYILAQIDKFDGNISRTAKFIGMERSALHRKLKSLGISLQDKDNEPANEQRVKAV